MTPTPPPAPRCAAARARLLRRTASAVALALLPFASVHASAGTPYAWVVEALLDGFHAHEGACPEVTATPWPTCFVAEPARVTILAEWLESFLDGHRDAIERGAWSSANGTHRVDLILRNGAWGVLELWLTESPGARVEGRIEIVNRRPP